MGFIVVSPFSWLLKGTIDKVLRKWTPSLVGCLLINQSPEIHPSIKAISLSSGVTYKSFVVESFGDSHGLLSTHMQ
jgi:hypothetical protein